MNKDKFKSILTEAEAHVNALYDMIRKENLQDLPGWKEMSDVANKLNSKMGIGDLAPLETITQVSVLLGIMSMSHMSKEDRDTATNFMETQSLAIVPSSVDNLHYNVDGTSVPVTILEKPMRIPTIQEPFAT